MKTKSTLLFLFICSLLNAQTKNLVGEIQKEDILNSSHKSWFVKNQETYFPNAENIVTLKKLLKKKKINIEVYFGTWCSDSKREVPRLLKLLEESNFNFKKLKLVALDRDKVVPNITEEERNKLNIKRVPTIIIYHKKKEQNRFVEFAQETLEIDLIKILSNQPYKHSYLN